MLSTSTMLTQSILITFRRIIGEFGRAAIDSRVSATSNPKTLFDLWLDLNLVRDLLKKSLNIPPNCWLSAFDRRLAGTSATLVRGIMTGGRCYPPAGESLRWCTGSRSWSDLKVTDEKRELNTKLPVKIYKVVKFWKFHAFQSETLWHRLKV